MANIALALSGGGSKGAFIVGALKSVRILLNTRRFRVVSGTSTGALIGTLLTTGEFAKLDKIYSNITTSDLLDPNHALVARILGPEAVLFASAIFGGTAIFDTTKLRNVIRKNIDFKKIKQVSGKTLLIYNAVDLQTGAAVTFDNVRHSAKILEQGLLASSNMPVLTDPVPITVDGQTHQYVDGGLRELLPLRAVFGSGVELDHIVAIATSPIQAKRAKKQYDDITDILGRSIDLLNTEVGRDDLRGARLYNAILRILANIDADVSASRALEGIDPMIKRSLRGKKTVPITFIGPDKHLEMDSLEFEPEAMRKAMKHGVECAKKALKNVAL